MSKAHRPFWVLRHRVSGAIRKVVGADSEDGMWEVVLSDGSLPQERMRCVGPHMPTGEKPADAPPNNPADPRASS